MSRLGFTAVSLRVIQNHRKNAPTLKGRLLFDDLWSIKITGVPTGLHNLRARFATEMCPSGIEKYFAPFFKWSDHEAKNNFGGNKLWSSFDSRCIGGVNRFLLGMA